LEQAKPPVLRSAVKHAKQAGQQKKNHDTPCKKSPDGMHSHIAKACSLIFWGTIGLNQVHGSTHFRRFFFNPKKRSTQFWVRDSGCKTGYTVFGRQKAVPVLEGEYQDAPGQQECLRCAAGTYQEFPPCRRMVPFENRMNGSHKRW